MTAALEGGEWSATGPGRTLPPGKTRYPLYRRLGGPQGRSGRAENLVPTGIRSRTVQPVVIRYTDWATWPTYLVCTWCKEKWWQLDQPPLLCLNQEVTESHVEAALSYCWCFQGHMRGRGRLCLAHGVGQGLRDGLRDSPAMSMSHEPRRLTLKIPGQQACPRGRHLILWN